jgi:hypothetical protein
VYRKDSAATTQALSISLGSLKPQSPLQETLRGL